MTSHRASPCAVERCRTHEITKQAVAGIALSNQSQFGVTSQLVGSVVGEHTNTEKKKE
jgi:hypothetical protein